ncbi:MAG: hypothetical protein ACI86M_003350, partial [Saprospiraceae bacterium]
FVLVLVPPVSFDFVSGPQDNRDIRKTNASALFLIFILYSD